MAYVDPRLRGKPAPVVPIEQMEREHVARLDRIKGSELAFLDQRIPGYRREIVNIIGMGVVENMADPDLKPKIQAPAHGFAVTYVRNTPRGMAPPCTGTRPRKCSSLSRGRGRCSGW